MAERIFHLNMPWVHISRAGTPNNLVVKSPMAKKELWKISDVYREGITVEQILACRLDKYVEKGLRVLTICNDGSGRSQTVQIEMNKVGIPSLRLRGGLKQFLQPEVRGQFTFAASQINTVPNVAIILTLEERQLFYGILPNLRAIKYLDSSHAIESLKRMELPNV